MSHSVLFVCLGNICRSPAAEGILRFHADQQGIPLDVESCGLGDWHLGQLPDYRMRQAAEARGIILSSRAQQFQPAHFDTFDLILPVDHTTLNDLYALAKRPDQKAKIHLVSSFSGSYKDREIPDPYYKGEGAFELVLDMLEDACQGLLEHLTRRSQ